MSTSIESGIAARLHQDPHRHEPLLGDAAALGDLLGLTDEVDRNLDLDRCVRVDRQEVDVGDLTTDRMALEAP